MFVKSLVFGPIACALGLISQVVVAGTYSDTVLADNPVAYYRLGETTGTVAANSSSAGASLDGNYVNFGVMPVAPLTPSLMGQLGPRPGNASGTMYISDGFESDNIAIRSGANGTAPSMPAQVEVPDNSALDITSALTLEAWVYRDPQAVNGNNEGIVGKYLGSPTGTNERSYCLYYNSRVVTGTSPSIGFVLSDTGAFKSGYDLNVPMNLPLGTDGGWTYLAATFVPGTRMALYVNGQLAVERTDPLGIPLSIWSGAAPLWIGRQFNPTASNVSFEGGIDEVAVYDTALSDATILAHYQAGTTATPPTLAGDFDSDGDVDGADFIAWQTHYPQLGGATLSNGDANGDGNVDGADFAAWQANFPTAPSSGVVAIPEPAAWILASFGLIGIVWRGRRS